MNEGIHLDLDTWIIIVPIITILIIFWNIICFFCGP